MQGGAYALMMKNMVCFGVGIGGKHFIDSNSITLGWTGVDSTCRCVLQ
jgi:hypothetical protein